uniref:WGS project CAEQ00000000 data, annotated contig 258 n=1 Tax=Trypanosoma congolense (strain IL3000) TaxID=1068625 RepID=F9WEF3_TRYCI|nr:unnamed protein product [Trypanosoma congolense IL3000]
MFVTKQSLQFKLGNIRLKQSSAPPRTTRANDPLTRWSQRICQGWSVTQRLPGLRVGLEGCAAAFNAMNSIRTCMHFGTGVPPSFLSLKCSEDIQNVRGRCYSVAGEGCREGEATSSFSALDGVAWFGESRFFEDPFVKCLPLIALENFTVRSKSLFTCRLPPASRLLVGHENFGVSEKYINGNPLDMAEKGNNCADHVVYIPQYGTISSLNVVTSMGVILFYAYLDTHFPASRSLAEDALERLKVAGGNDHLEALVAYQRCFQRCIPSVVDGSSVARVDPRPIHPMYYGKNVNNIIEAHRHLRSSLLEACSRCCHSGRVSAFGLSVLYENDTDMRSLGGIVRSANAFLVDRVFYFGRRKINVIGTVGTQHYTAPTYLRGPPETGANTADGWATWISTIENQLAEEGAPRKWWFLDCGHGFLYADAKQPDGDAAFLHGKSCDSLHSERLRWYTERCSDTSFTLSLCDSEEVLRDAVAEGVLLVVPQEGILPPLPVLQRCERMLTVFTQEHYDEQSPGLPVSVAVGIALQRLSAVMHPFITAL